MSARTHHIGALTRRHTASIQRRLNEPVIDQVLKTILCPTRRLNRHPLYTLARYPVSPPGRDLNSPEVARRGLLADAARARGSAVRATDGMLRRLPARRGRRRAARAVDRHVPRRRPHPGRRGWRDPLHRGRAAEEPKVCRLTAGGKWIRTSGPAPR